jgi:hypothetical protein
MLQGRLFYGLRGKNINTNRNGDLELEGVMGGVDGPPITQKLTHST